MKNILMSKLIEYCQNHNIEYWDDDYDDDAIIVAVESTKGNRFFTCRPLGGCAVSVYAAAINIDELLELFYVPSGDINEG